MVMGDLVREVDVAVVGGGPGGYSAAFRRAELGLEAVVVDAGARLGGACLHEGCIPSKALLHVAALMHEVEQARELGLHYGEPRLALDALRTWTAERVVGKLARGLGAVAKRKGVEVMAGARRSRTRGVSGSRATGRRRSASRTRSSRPARARRPCPGSRSRASA